MIRERILDEATSLGLRISQNRFGRWIVENLDNNKEWFLLLEQESNEWTIISNGVSEINLDSKSTLRMLKQLIGQEY